jgi:HSP20 family protein
MEKNIKASSGVEIGLLRKEIDRLHDDTKSNRSRTESSEKEIVPPIEVAENQERFTVEIELPGTNANDVRVSFAGYMLTLKGKKRKEKLDENGHTYRWERADEVFRKTFRIPAGAIPDRIEAKFSDDVLRIIVPKSTGAGIENMDINSA